MAVPAPMRAQSARPPSQDLRPSGGLSAQPRLGLVLFVLFGLFGLVGDRGDRRLFGS